MATRTLLTVLALTAIFSAASPAQGPCAQCSNLSPSNPWGELESGNRRFVSGRLQAREDACRRACTKDSQKPYAIVLSCSDSRVPPEIAFDQRIGDVFVVRVAGNVATDEAIGSIEYAIDHLKTPKIVVVLGHERCGAVEAAQALKPAPDLIPSILNRIFPAIQDIPPGDAPEDRLKDAIIRNVRYVKTLLPKYSPAISESHIPIRGAYYSVTNGTVTAVD